MIKNVENKKQVLVENFNEYKFNGGEEPATLRGYAEREAENDPGFFRWLFDDGNIGDFGFDLSKDQKQEFYDFVNNL